MKSSPSQVCGLFWVVLAVMLGGCASPGPSVRTEIARGPEAVSVDSLLGDLVDLDRLARRPVDSVQWFSNADGAGGAVVPPTRLDAAGRREWVLADARGPGAVASLWIADPADAGNLRFYLDDSPTSSAYQIAAADYLGGDLAAFPAPLAGPVGASWLSRVPVPFARRCVIATTAPPGGYAVLVRHFRAGTRVVPFAPPGGETLDRVRGLLLSNEAAPSDAEVKRWGQRFRETLGPGGQNASREVLGSGVLDRLVVRVAAADRDRALEGCILRITFDDQAEPSVEAPLGDFFGAGRGGGAYRTLAMGVDGDGTMHARWSMPYQHKAAVEFINLSSEPLTVSGEIGGRIEPWTLDRWYFRAGWWADPAMRTRPPADVALPWPSVGRVVGVTLRVSNPIAAWWGDGGARVGLGSSTQTALLSTPAWLGSGELTAPGRITPWGGLEAAAATTPTAQIAPWQIRTRVFLGDDQPTSPGGNLVWRVRHRGDCSLAARAMVYWYGPGDGGGIPRLDPGALEGAMAGAREPGTRRLAGAIECEDQPTTAPQGSVVVEASSRLGWSGGRQLLWRGAPAGAELHMLIDVPVTARYEVYLCATRAPGGALVAGRVGGDPEETRLDLDAPAERVGEPVSLGVHTLAAGRVPVTVRVVRAGGGIGLDYMVLAARGAAPGSPGRVPRLVESGGEDGE